MLKKWKNGAQFYTDDDEAKKFMKLLMIILGKPTKQASAVTGSLVKRGIEGQRFLMIRVLADYLLHVHLECSYITGGDNSNKGCFGSPMNNFMSSRKFRRPSRIFRWHSP